MDEAVVCYALPAALPYPRDILFADLDKEPLAVYEALLDNLGRAFQMFQTACLPKRWLRRGGSTLRVQKCQASSVRSLPGGIFSSCFERVGKGSQGEGQVRSGKILPTRLRQKSAAGQRHDTFFVASRKAWPEQQRMREKERHTLDLFKKAKRNKKPPLNRTGLPHSFIYPKASRFMIYKSTI